MCCECDIGQSLFFIKGSVVIALSLYQLPTFKVYIFCLFLFIKLLQLNRLDGNNQCMVELE